MLHISTEIIEETNFTPRYYTTDCTGWKFSNKGLSTELETIPRISTAVMEHDNSRFHTVKNTVAIGL